MSKLLSATFYIIIGVLMLMLAQPVEQILTDAKATPGQIAAIIITLISIGCFVRALNRIVQETFRIDEPVINGAEGSLGVARMAAPLSEAQRVRIARHEAGHALVAIALGHKVTRMSIAPKGVSAGRTHWQHKDNVILSLDHLTVAYAGAIADKVLTRRPHSPTGDDDVSILLRDAISLSTFDPEGRSPHELLALALTRARGILESEHALLDVLTKMLARTEGKRDLEHEEIHRIAGHLIHLPTHKNY